MQGKSNRREHLHMFMKQWKWVTWNPRRKCTHTSQLCILNILIYSMVQSPSWGANWFAASQDSQNPKVHYRTHKRPPPVSIRARPIQSIYPHPTPWRSILILPTHLFHSGFPTKTLYNPLTSPICDTCPAHLILLDFITCTILGEEYKSLNILKVIIFQQIKKHHHQHHLCGFTLTNILSTFT